MNSNPSLHSQKRVYILNNAGCVDVYSHGSLQQHKSISLADTPVSCEIILWILQGMLSKGWCWELQDTRDKANKITTFGTGFQTPLCLQTPGPFCISWVSLGKYEGPQLTFPYYQAQEAIGEPLKWHISFEHSTGVCSHGHVVEVKVGRAEPSNYNVFTGPIFILKATIHSSLHLACDVGVRLEWDKSPVILQYFHFSGGYSVK